MHQGRSSSSIPTLYFGPVSQENRHHFRPGFAAGQHQRRFATQTSAKVNVQLDEVEDEVKVEVNARVKVEVAYLSSFPFYLLFLYVLLFYQLSSLPCLCNINNVYVIIYVC